MNTVEQAMLSWSLGLTKECKIILVKQKTLVCILTVADEDAARCIRAGIKGHEKYIVFVILF